MPDWLLWIEHFISTVGFPIFVACFLLIAWWKQWAKMVKTLEALKDAIEALSRNMTGHVS